MSLFGLTTKKDLSGWGTFLFAALLMLIIAMIMNFIFMSPVLDIMISAVAVFVFVGLTAYDAQTIKASYVTGMESRTEGIQLALMGALEIYLDFINLFIHLLQLLGDKD